MRYRMSLRKAAPHGTTATHVAAEQVSAMWQGGVKDGMVGGGGRWQVGRNEVIAAEWRAERRRHVRSGGGTTMVGNGVWKASATIRQRHQLSVPPTRFTANRTVEHTECRPPTRPFHRW